MFDVEVGEVIPPWAASFQSMKLTAMGSAIAEQAMSSLTFIPRILELFSTCMAFVPSETRVWSGESATVRSCSVTVVAAAKVWRPMKTLLYLFTTRAKIGLRLRPRARDRLLNPRIPVIARSGFPK